MEETSACSDWDEGICQGGGYNLHRLKRGPFVPNKINTDVVRDGLRDILHLNFKEDPSMICS